MEEKNRIRGRRAIASGRRFEAKTRQDLEGKGFICSKWQNTVDLDQDRLVPAKSGRFRRISTGFPDFITFKVNKGKVNEFMFVEVKSDGYLDKEEKIKARWYINKFGLPFLIAKKSKKRGKIEYKEFKLEEK